MFDITEIDDFIKNNNQYPDKPNDSELWRSIQLAFDCSDKKAIEFGKYHCNSISSYILFYAHGWIRFHYSTWCKKLLDEGMLSKRGWVQADLKEIAVLFGFDDKFNKLKYFYNYYACMNAVDMSPDHGYKIKVYSNSNKLNDPDEGTHFMPAFVEDGKLYLSDPSNRGIHVLARNVIPKEKFIWAVEV